MMSLTSAIGWALVHSVWQAGLIAALTAAGMFLLRGVSAAARYWLAVAAMSLMVCAPIVTAVISQDRVAAGRQDAGFVSAMPRDHADAGVSGTSVPEQAPTTSAVSGASEPTAAPSQSLKLKLEAAFPWIVGLWLLGVVLFSARTISGVVWARRLVRDGTRPVRDEVRGAAARIATSMGVRVAVGVLESSRASVPMLVGWLRPVILIPGTLFSGLMPQQLEAILAHELAHVRRNDYAVNLLQIVVETLYFFHPAAWWLSGRIREERENACDELAVAACGGDRVFYSRVLLTVEESRGKAPGLAVAASGGSLSRRIYRLLGAQQTHLDIGPRWYAGVFTIGLVVVTAGGVMDGELGLMDAGRSEWVVSADTGSARPDTVIRFAGTGPLDERWTWATAQARRNGYDRYWVGYLIDGDESGQTWIHFDRHTTVSLSGGVTSAGHMRFRGGFDGVRMPGVPLSGLIGEYESYRIAVFMGYEGGQLQRLHLGSFVFPVHFASAPVLWLGTATDAESIDRLVRLDGVTRDTRMREDITAAIGAHSDVAVVTPVLERWAQERGRPPEVREEAVEALGHVSSPRALAVLARIARSDDDERIRAEAVEAIGHLEVAAALDTLRDFVRSLPSEQLRDEAVEALASLPDRRRAAALREIIDDRSLGSRLRRTAVEELAHSDDAPDLLATLARYTNQHDDREVQREAVETMAEVQANEDERIEALVNVVERHPDPDIQARAAEALGQVPAREAAQAALLKIVRDHRSEHVRRRAVEALGNVTGDDRAARLLLEIARTHPDQETQREAVETLENFRHLPIFEEVANIAFSNQAIDVRRTAVETYMSGVESGAAVAFARRLLATDAPYDVRREVIESLSDLRAGAGIPVIIDLARSAPDAQIRREALEALIDSEDPRAVAALRRVQ